MEVMDSKSKAMDLELHHRLRERLIGCQDSSQSMSHLKATTKRWSHHLARHPMMPCILKCSKMNQLIWLTLMVWISNSKSCPEVLSKRNNQLIKLKSMISGPIRNRIPDLLVDRWERKLKMLLKCIKAMVVNPWWIKK